MNQPGGSHINKLDFESDLRISSTLLSVAAIVIGIVTIYVAYLPAILLHQVLVLGFGCFLLTVGPLTMWLEQHRRQSARWLVILALAASAHVTSLWAGVQTSFILIPLTVTIGVAGVGFRPALTVAIIQTIAILLLPFVHEILLPSSVLVVAIVAIWGNYLIMAAVYRPVQGVGRWVYTHYIQTFQLMNETRQHREEYERLVKDLAQANLHLTRLNTVAQGLRQTAEEARVVKEQFVANVSHELRTPLNMILGFSEMILQSPQIYGGKVHPALLADLDVIHRNAEHLTHLIDDVLDLSQIEADQMALTKDYANLSEIIKSAMSAVRPLFESKRLYLDLDTTTDQALPLVFCDPTRIQEVLLNLLSNAGRFTEQGGVRINAHCHDDMVVVSVTDTGRGIVAKDMGKLFQPFQQLDGSVRRSYGGTGLGLNISKRFIELHGGDITAESTVGKGTTFTFRIPINPAVLPATAPARWLNPDWTDMQRISPSVAPNSVVRPRLLVLEAGKVLQRLLTRYMDDVEVTSVSTIEQAAADLERTPANTLIVGAASIARGIDQVKAVSPLPRGVPALICVLPSIHDLQAGMPTSNFLVKPISQADLLGMLDQLNVFEGLILIVDDEPDALQLFSRMLAASQRGYRVLQARNGSEAISILAEHHPNVILLDLVMPSMDGFQLLEVLSESPTLHTIPTVVISARDPAGRPIVSNALAVIQEGGISARQLLACIRTLSQTLNAPHGAVPKPQVIPSV